MDLELVQRRHAFRHCNNERYLLLNTIDNSLCCTLKRNEDGCAIGLLVPNRLQAKSAYATIRFRRTDLLQTAIDWLAKKYSPTLARCHPRNEVSAVFLPHAVVEAVLRRYQ